MKNLKSGLLITAMTLCFASLANAQTDSTQKPVNIPESYQSTQEQLTEDGSVGAATYNIDENTPVQDPSAASWRAEEDEEELKVYSGSHDGNNYVQTIRVKVPVKNQDPYSAGSQNRR